MHNVESCIQCHSSCRITITISSNIIQHETGEQYCSFLSKVCRTFRAVALCQMLQGHPVAVDLKRLETSCTHWIESCSIAHQFHGVSTDAAMSLYGIKHNSLCCEKSCHAIIILLSCYALHVWLTFTYFEELLNITMRT